jgi:hypothetical protein
MIDMYINEDCEGDKELDEREQDVVLGYTQEGHNIAAVDSH